MRKKLALIAMMTAGLLAQNNATTAPFADTIQKLNVKAPLTDPAYNMPIDMHSKLLCEATLTNGKTAYFISPKAAMMVYLHQDYFLKRKLLEDEITTLYVRDYLSGKTIEASKAVYVFGSRIIGPHGDDLIPLSSEERAKLFELKYGGTKILPYTRIDQGLIRYLDM